jgi:hypothetical protein
MYMIGHYHKTINFYTAFSKRALILCTISSLYLSGFKSFFYSNIVAVKKLMEMCSSDSIDIYI